MIGCQGNTVRTSAHIQQATGPRRPRDATVNPSGICLISQSLPYEVPAPRNSSAPCTWATSCLSRTHGAVCSSRSTVAYPCLLRRGCDDDRLVTHIADRAREDPPHVAGARTQELRRGALRRHVGECALINARRPIRCRPSRHRAACEPRDCDLPPPIHCAGSLRACARSRYARRRLHVRSPPCAHGRG